MRYWQKSICVLALVLWIIGCQSRTNTVRWEGEVTYQGAPVESGSIRFEPVGGAGKTAGATIVRGKYSVELVPGKYTVEVIATREVGSVPAYEGSTEDTIPVTEVVGKHRETVEVTSSTVRNFALDKP